MSIILIVIYCLTAVVILFGLTFHDELLQEKQRKRKVRLIAIPGGKHYLARVRRHS
jgi:hypothetical protein